MDNALKKIRSNVFIRDYLKVFSVDVLVKASGIILLPVYLRLMSQEEFGLYGYLIAIVNTFSLVLNFGIYVAQSKLYFDYPKEKTGSVLFTLNVILFSFILVIVSSLLYFDLDRKAVDLLFKTDFDYQKYRFTILVGVVVAVYSLMTTNYFFASRQIGKVQSFNIARIVLIHAVSISLLLLIKDEDAALARLKYSFYCEFVIVAFFGAIYAREIKLNFDFDIALKAIKLSLPIVISAIIGLVINLSDRFFLEKYGTLRDLAIYNVALTISGVVPFVFASFQNIWLPQFIQEKDKEVMNRRFKRMFLLVLLGFLGLSGLILAAMKAMLIFNIIERKYEEVLALLPIVLTSGTVAALTAMYSNHLIRMNKTYYVILAGIPIAFVSLLLNAKLVPIFHVFGAATSLLIVNLCYLILYYLIVRLHRKALAESREI